MPLRTSMPRSAERTASALAHATLSRRWKRFRSGLRACRRGCSEDDVHQLRVAARRLLATIEVFQPFLGPDAVRTSRRQLKRHLQLFAPLRDLHVQCALLGALAWRFPELKPVQAWLQGKVPLILRRVRRKLRRPNVAALKAQMRNELRGLASRGTGRVRSSCDRLLRSADEAFAEVRAARRDLDASDAATVHRLRLAFKRFRYRVEALAPLLPRLTAGDFRTMRGLQLRMGRIQDLDVLAGILTKAAGKRRWATAAGFKGPLRWVITQQRSAIQQLLRRAPMIDRWPPSSRTASGAAAAPLHRRLPAARQT
jgi:CHAD domain-containing protein